jgi:hypothetical protein
MHTYTRILTKLTPVWALADPRELLVCGKTVFTDDDRVRTFFLRKVLYDDDMTLLYTKPSLVEKQYTSLVELFKENPSYRDTVILDCDNKYKTYKP